MERDIFQEHVVHNVSFLQLVSFYVRESDLIDAKDFNLFRARKTKEIYFLIRKSTNGVRFS